MVVLKPDLLRIPVRARTHLCVRALARARACVRTYVSVCLSRVYACAREGRCHVGAAQSVQKGLLSALRVSIMRCPVCVLSKHCSCEHRGYAAQAQQAEMVQCVMRCVRASGLCLRVRRELRGYNAYVAGAAPRIDKSMSRKNARSP